MFNVTSYIQWVSNISTDNIFNSTLTPHDLQFVCRYSFCSATTTATVASTTTASTTDNATTVSVTTAAANTSSATYSATATAITMTRYRHRYYNQYHYYSQYIFKYALLGNCPTNSNFTQQCSHG